MRGEQYCIFLLYSRCTAAHTSIVLLFTLMVVMTRGAPPAAFCFGILAGAVSSVAVTVFTPDAVYTSSLSGVPAVGTAAYTGAL